MIDKAENVRNKRIRAEEEYYLIKKSNSDINDYILYRSERINCLLQMKDVYSDPILIEFYKYDTPFLVHCLAKNNIC